jgi:hypothetical protein
MEGARDCLVRCMGASWWEWMAGSRLLFWRWPQESQVWARDGLPIPLERLLTPYRKPQPREANPNVVTAVRAKLDKFRNKGYVVKGTVESLTSYFTVPKGDGDVRIGHKNRKCGPEMAFPYPWNAYRHPTESRSQGKLTPMWLRLSEPSLTNFVTKGMLSRELWKASQATSLSPRGMATSGLATRIASVGQRWPSHTPGTLTDTLPKAAAKGS